MQFITEPVMAKAPPQLLTVDECVPGKVYQWIPRTYDSSREDTSHNPDNLRICVIDQMGKNSKLLAALNSGRIVGRVMTASLNLRMYMPRPDIKLIVED